MSKSVFVCTFIVLFCFVLATPTYGKFPLRYNEVRVYTLIVRLLKVLLRTVHVNIFGCIGIINYCKRRGSVGNVVGCVTGCHMVIGYGVILSTGMV